MKQLLKITGLCVLIIFVILISQWFNVRAQSGQLEINDNSPPTMDELLSSHELLRYEVKYTFLKLGEVELEIVNDTLYQGKRAWHFRGKITSSGIPIVGNEENHYNSIFYLHEGKPRELVYWKDDLDSRLMNEERYEYDYEREKVYAFKEGEPTDTLDLIEPATSGPLIFFYSRLKAGMQDTSVVNIYLENEKGDIDFWFTDNTDKRRYDPFDKKIAAFYSEGDADFEGPFGFSGRFRAWVADNPLRIPVEAHLKVWLGNVKVRLIDYQIHSDHE